MMIFRILEKLHLTTIFGNGLLGYIMCVVNVMIGLLVFIESFKCAERKVTLKISKAKQ